MTREGFHVFDSACRAREYPLPEGTVLEMATAYKVYQMLGKGVLWDAVGASHDASNGLPHAISGGSITEGEYKITMRGGVPGGSHRVEIRSFRKLPKPYPDMPDVMVPKEELLPKKFNKQSELQREIEPNRSMTPDFPWSD